MLSPVVGPSEVWQLSPSLLHPSQHPADTVGVSLGPAGWSQVSGFGRLWNLTWTFLTTPLPGGPLPCSPPGAPCSTRSAGPTLFPHCCSHFFTFASNSAVFQLVSMFSLKSR